MTDHGRAKPPPVEHDRISVSNTTVLEAVMVSVIMMSAVAYVSTVEGPRQNPNVVIDLLNQHAMDFLLTADAATLKGSCQGKTTLTDLVIKGINGNHTKWKDRMRGFFGAGISAGLTLSNGRGSILLHGTPVENGAGRTVRAMPDCAGPPTVAPLRHDPA